MFKYENNSNNNNRPCLRENPQMFFNRNNNQIEIGKTVKNPGKTELELHDICLSKSIENQRNSINSTTNLLNPAYGSSSNSINLYDNHNSLIIPSASCGFNRSSDSPALRRFSDTSYSKRKPSDAKDGSFDDSPIKDKFQIEDNKPLHYRSHHVLSHSRGLGIDEIGLDFMRANGAIPGSRYLTKSLSKTGDQKSSILSLVSNNRKLSSFLPNFCQNLTSKGGINKSISCTAIQQPYGLCAPSPLRESASSSCCGSNTMGAGAVCSNQFHTKSDQMCNSRYPKKVSHVSIGTIKTSSHKNPYKYQTQRSMKSVGYRLGRRKELFEKRMRISDFSLSFAIFGIIVMVIDTELLWAGVYKKGSNYSTFLRSLISISTIILIGLILAYHALIIQIKLFSYDDCIEDWKIAINWKSVAQLLLELAICSIHPAPGINSISFYLNSWWSSREQTPVFAPAPDLAVPSIPPDERLENLTDPLLALPMLMRFYMIFRSLLLHSRMFRDAGSRSIGAMNKVNFDTRFILKTLMTICPGTMLLTFILSFWILQSWCMRMCEINSAYPDHARMLNSMWLIAVTFLSIGYGDIVPHTNCGRTIAVCSGLMGSACTALLVAVFARKLELTKAEKHVTQFMLENQLTKKLKYYAANVLRETWLIYKYTKLAKQVNASRVRKHQRKFLTAIHGLRKLKIDQRKFKDNSNTLVDLAKTQSNIYETVTEMRVEHNCLDSRIVNIETSIISLQEQINRLPHILHTIIKDTRHQLEDPNSYHQTQQPHGMNPS